jgi:indole-3-glycerol phosphate synthase/phosphoribosylanthranilate isomerase
VSSRAGMPNGGVSTPASAANVLQEIAGLRRQRIRSQGHEMGAAVPASRTVPLVPFGADPFVVCEVKRRSPSRGEIAPGRDAVEQARRYADHGARSISVLTEQDRFDGSLEDLGRIKQALPHLSVLRKDFLLDVEDVEVSWRMGADAVLLIASLLERERLEAMHAAAGKHGMSALVELHDAADVDKCRTLAPGLIGINCRDLRTFHVDLLDPVFLLPRVDWAARAIFESGIRAAEDVLLARSAGFEGVLVGEAAMRQPRLIPELAQALRFPPGGFWPRLGARREVAARPGRPLVKVCGITRPEDAEMARSLGADALGFVLAPSKRRADPRVLRDLRDMDILKIAVVVTEKPAGRRRLDPEVRELLAAGLVDAVQLHGDEEPGECAALAFPYYKASRIRGLDDVQGMKRYRSPRVLADAWAADAAGGTGQRLPEELARAAREAGPLWLAGGIGPANVGDVIERFSPELIDSSSALEESTGRKDAAKLRKFFEEIRKHEKV